MSTDLTFAIDRFPSIRFVLVNNRIPRMNRHCALCGDVIEKGYVRDPVVAGGLASYEAKDRSSRLFFLLARHVDLFPMRGLLPKL